jgi:hypothetical protein
MAGRVWHRHLASAVCLNCPWRRTSRTGAAREHDFVTRYARRHAETWGHEVEVGVEKYVTYKGAPRRVPAARRRWKE